MCLGETHHPLEVPILLIPQVCFLGGSLKDQMIYVESVCLWEYRISHRDRTGSLLCVARQTKSSVLSRIQLTLHAGRPSILCFTCIEEGLKIVCCYAHHALFALYLIVVC